MNVTFTLKIHPNLNRRGVQRSSPKTLFGQPRRRFNKRICEHYIFLSVTLRLSFCQFITFFTVALAMWNLRIAVDNIFKLLFSNLDTGGSTLSNQSQLFHYWNEQGYFVVKYKRIYLHSNQVITINFAYILQTLEYFRKLVNSYSSLNTKVTMELVWYMNAFIFFSS